MLGQIIVLIIIKNPQITASMAVIFDRTILSAPEAVIFGSLQVVFFYCPFLDYLNHGVTTVTLTTVYQGTKYFNLCLTSTLGCH